MAEPQMPDLASMVEGHSDQEITSAIEKEGTDKVLGDIFNAMAGAFVPEAAAGQSAIVQYDITAPDATRSYQLKVASGKCTVQKGSVEPARVTLALALADFMRMIAGKLDGMQAFMTGKLRLSGDMMFAQTMQTWFRRQ